MYYTLSSAVSLHKLYIQLSTKPMGRWGAEGLSLTISRSQEASAVEISHMFKREALSGG